MRVTFDSNVWQMIVMPALARNTDLHNAYEIVHDGVRNGQVQGFICETVGTLEAVRISGRKTYFTSLRPRVEVKTDFRAGQGLMTINIDPNHDQHPGLPKVLTDRLEIAYSLGIRLMRAVRMGIPTPASFLNLSVFADEHDVPTSAARDNRWGEILETIEQRGVGAAALVALDEELGKTNSESDAEKRFASAIGEWADGDSIAAHVAYGNDVFCTHDQGKSAGRKSILDADNREWLAERYDVQFATIEELAARVHPTQLTGS